LPPGVQHAGRGGASAGTHDGVQGEGVPTSGVLERM
jgi:hypothetical protein